MADTTIGFVDVGSGGDLKYPWNLLPAKRLLKFAFEPTQNDARELPVCISNREGETEFFVAKDERASSFHQASSHFAERFGQHSILGERTIKVACTTLDRYFADRYGDVDALDVNVEGHDYQVLQGAEGLLRSGFIKLAKIEFELTEVWHGQGWFADIDRHMRERDFDLVNLEIQRSRPVNSRHVFHPGEVIWGKAYYVPSAHAWRSRVRRISPGEENAGVKDIARAVALCVAADLPGRAFDTLDIGKDLLPRCGIATEQVKAGIAAAFKWAKLEAGIAQLQRLASASLGAHR